jgi:hypothetical protein
MVLFLESALLCSSFELDAICVTEKSRFYQQCASYVGKSSEEKCTICEWEFGDIMGINMVSNTKHLASILIYKEI